MKYIAVLSALLALFSLAGCQTSDAPAATTEVVVAAETETAAAPAPAPAPAPVQAAPEEESAESTEAAEPEETPVVGNYTYLGYEMSVVSYDGICEIKYPDFVTDDEVAAFFASEVEKYGSLLDGVIYMFGDGGSVKVAYPEGIDAAVRAEYIDIFASDLLAYVSQMDITPAV